MGTVCCCKNICCSQEKDRGAATGLIREKKTCTHVAARSALAKGEWEQQDAIAATVDPDGWRAAHALEKHVVVVALSQIGEVL